jgi:hypothetical protein
MGETSGARPTACLHVTSLVASSCGYDDGKSGPTHCAVIGAARGDRCQGDLPKAIPLLERGLGLCQGAHIQVLLPLVAVALSYAYALAGRVAEALPLARQERPSGTGYCAAFSRWKCVLRPAPGPG